MPIILNGINGIITPALDSTGDVTITDKIIHAGDANTSIRFPDDNIVTVETNGAERLRVDSAGKLLSPGGAAFVGTVATGSTNGAIIERGSNANGEFVKFADGTMICTQTFPQEISSTWTFPVAYSTAPRIQATNTVGNLPRFCSVSGPSTTSVIIYRWTDGGGTSASFAHGLAIGRWF
jgi:hypothetical protein